MEAAMKILLCTPFEKAAPKGNSVAAARLAAGFQRHGHAVSVLDYPAVSDDRAIVDTARQFQPDVAVVMHAWRCGPALLTIQRTLGVPVVVSLRGTDLNEMLDDTRTGAEVRAVLSACDAVVVFHDKAKMRLFLENPLWDAKTVIIPNGVELPESNADYRRQLGIPAKAFVFATIAGLRQVKRPLWIVPLLTQLRDQHMDIWWMHAGQPIEPSLAEEMRLLTEWNSWIRHLDHVPHEEIASFLRAADVVVSASRSEGMPHAVREAMLAGRALLLSAIEGHRNLAAPEQEALFFKDESDFTQQAVRLIQDARLRCRLGAAARARVLADLARCDEITAYLGLFRSLIEKKGTGT
jgi:glycosyltransferase involved in cell wall biosynthesis